MASLAALASTPEGREFIKSMVREEGDHFVVTFADGHTEVVDREFWWHSKNQALAYAQTSGDDMWVPVIEEAYAKYRGGDWEDVTGGRHPDGRFDFDRAYSDIGLPTEQVESATLTDGEWAEVLTGHAAVTLASVEEGHAFAVVEHIPGTRGVEDRVRIYNPWHQWGGMRFPELTKYCPVYHDDGTVVLTLSQAKEVFEYASFTDVR
jgi:hypothetical protein